MGDLEEKQTLRSLVQTSLSLTEALIENGGDLTPDMENALSVVDILLPQKVDNYALLMEHVDNEEEFWKSKADLYYKMAKGCKTVRERLKDSIKNAMKELNVDELIGVDQRFKLSNSKPALEVDEANLDSSYMIHVTKVEVDKKRIEEDLKIGVPVKGARLIETKSLRTYLNRGVK